MKSRLSPAASMFLLAVLPVCFPCAGGEIGPRPGEKWRAVHLIGYRNDRSLESLATDVPHLAKLGINARKRGAGRIERREGTIGDGD